MFQIVEKKILNDEIIEMAIKAPFIAKKALPGQFIIFRVDEFSERIPLTIAANDAEKGTVSIIFQRVGKSTRHLGKLEVGDKLLDFVGPLGVASHLDEFKKVCVIGGGLGTAIALPQAKYLHEQGAQVDVIAGFRSKDIVILEQEMKKNSNRLFITTDDGSYGEKGFVTTVLSRLIEEGNDYDAVIAIGPLVMMRAICQLTKEHNIKTIVSMNPVMLDGTGMCGACRLTVNGEIKFACVDGPDFDGHQVDFNEAISRSTMFEDMERESDEHYCKLTGGVRRG